MSEKTESAVQEEQRLRGSTAWQKKPHESAVLLGTSVEQFLSRRNQRFNQAGRLAQAWDLALPEAMRSHCRPAGYDGGVLTVEADTGPFLHQLQTMKSQLIMEIKTRCPRCGLREIRILPGPTRQEKVQR